MTPEQRAARAAALLRDEVLTGAVADLTREATDRMLLKTTAVEQLSEARHMVWALQAVMDRLQAYVDEQAMLIRRNKGDRR